VRGILLLAAALLAGWGIDFRAITSPCEVSQPTRLEVLLRYEDPNQSGFFLPERGVTVSALLAPGTDEKGWPRRVADDALYVAGVRIRPVRKHRDGTLEYQAWIPLRGPTPEGILLSVSAPGVDREDRPPVVYEVIPVRVGADSLEVAAGGELRLPFARQQSSWVLPGEESWQLGVSGGAARWDTSSVRLPSSPLVLPVASLPGAPGGWLHARLVFQRRAVLDRAGTSRYRLELHSVADLIWRVRRTADPTLR